MNISTKFFIQVAKLKNNLFFKSAYGKLCLVFVLAVTVLLSLRLGSAQMSWADFLSALMRKTGYETFTTIIYSVRLPRISGAMLAGAGLSVSGVLLQAVTQNPLASPNIIGVNAGAGFAVILTMLFLPTNFYIRPITAFFGAFLTTMLIIAVSSKVGTSKSVVILAGIAVTTLLNACISFISYFDSDLLANYNTFSVGGVSGVDIAELKMPLLIIAISFLTALFIAPKADILCLGDSIALSLGVNVRVVRTLCLVLSSATAAATVSFAGLLGFVGLVVPHIGRRLAGAALKDLLIISAMLGAILVVTADLFGRVILAPSEIPVGIVMAFVGAPFLFYLLLRRKRNAEI